jgi:hypothetical protein
LQPSRGTRTDAGAIGDAEQRTEHGGLNAEIDQLTGIYAFA